MQKYKEHSIKKGLKDISRQETLGESFSFTTGQPNSGITLLALGEEMIIKTLPRTHEIYYPGTNNRLIYEFDITQTKDGQAGRIIAYAVKRIGPSRPYAQDVIEKHYGKDRPEAGLLYRIINGKPTIVDILVEKDVRGKGLATALVKEFKNQFGQIRAIGPFSQEGKKVIEKFPEGVEVIKFPEEGRHIIP